MIIKSFHSGQRVIISGKSPTCAKLKGTVALSVYYMDTSQIWIKVDGVGARLIEEKHLKPLCDHQCTPAHKPK